MRRSKELLAALALIAIATATTTTASPVRPQRRGPDVLLVTIDTWRWDYLGATGNGKVATPNLDALAAAGLLFVDTRVAAPVTLVSHASLFTGLAPPSHGVHHNSGFRLGEDATTLAEVLQQAGYYTAAVTGAFVLNSRFGLAQGFDTYLDVFPADLYGEQELSASFPELTADQVTDRAVRVLQRAPRDRPWFLWVHYFDPHAEYRAPAELAARYPDDPYAAEVAFVDRELGRLLAAAAGRDPGAPQIVLVTADHGESLGEHGEATHGHFLYEPTVRVDTLLRLPHGPRGRTVTTPVRSVDLAPTLLARLGLAAPGKLDGHDLAPLWEGGEVPRAPAYAETFLPWYDYGWGYLRSLVFDGWKYIAGPRPELYDLVHDPQERHDLVRAEPERAARLAAALERFVAGAAPPDPGGGRVGPSSAEQSALASLGYAAFSTRAPRSTTPRRSPGCPIPSA